MEVTCRRQKRSKKTTRRRVVPKGLCPESWGNSAKRRAQIAIGPHLSLVFHQISYDPSYHPEVIAALDGFTQRDRKKIDALLEDLTHHPNSWVDETHAFALADSGMLEEIGVNKRRLRRVHGHLKSIFKKYRDL